jgi:hypothetical protein
MSVIDIINVQIDRFNVDATGIVASNVYELYDASLDAFFWVVDVDLDQAQTNPNAPNVETLIGVPIDDPSRDVFSAGIGVQVALRRRQSDMRYVVSGLTKYAPGQLSVCLVTIDESGTTILPPVTYGCSYRELNFSELGDPLLNGGFTYGELPYNTAGKFNQSGTLVTLIT